MKQFWTFDLKTSIDNFINTMDDKCFLCETAGWNCSDNELHLSYRYMTESEDGKFIRRYLSLAQSQKLFLENYDQ